MDAFVRVHSCIYALFPYVDECIHVQYVCFFSNSTQEMRKIGSLNELAQLPYYWT